MAETRKWGIPTDPYYRYLWKLFLPSGKFWKAEAAYLDRAFLYKCRTCRFFLKEKSECRLVEGTISADGTCVLWTHVLSPLRVFRPMPIWWYVPSLRERLVALYPKVQARLPQRPG